MKLFVKLLVLLLVVAVSGPYFIKGPDGAPLWTVRDTAAAVQSAFARLRHHPVAGAVTPAGNAVEVFRWQDDSGQWHFTNVAPDGESHSVLRIDPRTNAISVVVSREPLPGDENLAVDDSPVARATHIGPLPDPATARRLIEDARALQLQADERAAVLSSPD